LGDFLLYHRDTESFVVTGQYVPENLGFSIRNCEAGQISYEIPLGEPFLTFEEFGPYRTDYALYRRGGSGNYSLMVEGMVTSVNLNKDRDSILIGGKDWLHYLERRNYPFDPVKYRAGDWVNWPKQWPQVIPPALPQDAVAVDARDVVEDILDAMMNVTLPKLPGGVPATPFRQNVLPISFNNKLTGTKVMYRIFPGDQTSVFEHIQKLSQLHDGFEFDILPGSLEFKMWAPDRLTSQPVWRIKGVNNPLTSEAGGAVIEADWTNDGPEGTFLVGLGTAEHRTGAVWYYKPSIDKYRWLDKFYDFGELANTGDLIVPGDVENAVSDPEDMIFRMLKDQDDLFPQRKLGITLLNPEFMSPNFYTGGRPRQLIGQRVNFQHDWNPYWRNNADYRVNALNWTVDQSANESVELELELLYEDV
jgi:hypothetical protein